MTAVEYAKAIAAFDESTTESSVGVSFKDMANISSLFLELISVLDTVIENAEQDTAHLENSPYGDPVWREREGVRLAKRLETYKALRVKCG